MSAENKQLLIDIGSTYFKVAENGAIRHYFRDFGRNIFDDLMAKCGETLTRYAPQDIRICSSANGGLSTLIIGLSRSFSLRYAVNIAYNSGINIIDTLLYREIGEAIPPVESLDVIIIVGGIDGRRPVFDERLNDYLERVDYRNIVYVGNRDEGARLAASLPGLVCLENVLDDELRMRETDLKQYLTDLYQADIMGKEEIKRFYEITSNQIYSTPYVVNRALPRLHGLMEIADPYLLIDIGGATTDIHYSRDLVRDNIVTESGYDRMVFKKLGVFKSRESLVYSARNNEYVFELLNTLNVTENILEEESEAATRILMQLAIFLVLFKMSRHHSEYIVLDLERLNTILFTGGITKLLSDEEIEAIVRFFYRKILRYHKTPATLIDRNYAIWTLGLETLAETPNKEST